MSFQFTFAVHSSGWLRFTNLPDPDVQSEKRLLQTEICAPKTRTKTIGPCPLQMHPVGLTGINTTTIPVRGYRSLDQIWCVAGVLEIRGPIYRALFQYPNILRQTMCVTVVEQCEHYFPKPIITTCLKNQLSVDWLYPTTLWKPRCSLQRDRLDWEKWIDDVKGNSPENNTVLSVSCLYWSNRAKSYVKVYRSTLRLHIYIYIYMHCSLIQILLKICIHIYMWCRISANNTMQVKTNHNGLICAVWQRALLGVRLEWSRADLGVDTVKQMSQNEHIKRRRRSYGKIMCENQQFSRGDRYRTNTTIRQVSAVFCLSPILTEISGLIIRFRHVTELSQPLITVVGNTNNDCFLFCLKYSPAVYPCSESFVGIHISVCS